MLDILKKAIGQCFLIGSGQHIDRLCAAFRACKRAGRIFVLDIYTAYIFRLVSNRFENVPDFTDKHFRVLTKGKTASSHYSKVANNRQLFREFISDIFSPGTQIGKEKILKNPSRFFIKISNFKDLLTALRNMRISVIYSQWEGYKKEEFNHGGFKKFIELENNSNIDFHDVHTSGHATVCDLQKLAMTVDAKMLVPIHTEYANEYRKHFAKVQLMKDSEAFSVQMNNLNT